jgi:hypothetical protein
MDKSENEKKMEKYLWPDGDPAIINPQELASFPKLNKSDYSRDEHNEIRHPHPVSNNVSAVRSKRNITHTGPETTDENGFL